MKKHHWAILLATLYLVVYTLLVETSANMLLLATLFAGFLIGRCPHRPKSTIFSTDINTTS